MKTLKKVSALSLALLTTFGLSQYTPVQAESGTDKESTVTETEEKTETDDTAVSSTGKAASATREETVYIISDANGDNQNVIVSSWLKNKDKASTISDSTTLKDIQNVEGDETYKVNTDGTIDWDAQGKDIYYQGTTDQKLPVSVKISYQLDGKDVSADEIAGKSGHVKIRFDYENDATEEVDVDGKKKTVIVPFAMVSGVELSGDNFSNVTAENGKVISSGKNNYVVGMAFPGLKDALNIKNNELTEDVDIPEYFEIDADATDFKLDMTLTMASSDILNDLDLDSIDSEELKSDLDQLQDGADQLLDGTKDLKDGTKELRDGADDLADGTTTLKNGTSDLASGSDNLADGAHKVDDGAGDLKDGADKVASGASQVDDGTAQVQDGAKKLSTGAASAAAGAKTLADGATQLSAGTEELQTGAGLLQDGITLLYQSVHQYDDTTSAAYQQMASQVGTLAIAKGEAYGQQLASSTTGQPLDNSPILTQIQALLAAPASAKQAPLFEDQWDEEDQEEKPNVVTGEDSGTDVTPDEFGANTLNDSSNDAASPTAADASLTGNDGDTDSSDIPSASGEALEGNDDETGENAAAETPQDESTQTPADSPTDTSTVTTDTTADDAAGTTAAIASKDLASDLLELMDNETTDNTQKVQQIMQLVINNEATAYGQGYAAGYQDGSSTTLKTIANGTDPTVGGLDNLYQAVVGEKDEKGETSNDLKHQVAKISGGAEQVKSGADSLNSGLSDINTGASSLSSGADTLKNGTSSLKSGASDLATGAGTLKSGTSDLASGADTLKSGAHDLDDGAGELLDGVLKLKDGTIDLDDGAQELLDGMQEFYDEGITKLVNAIGDDLPDTIDNLEAVVKAGQKYTSFAGNSDSSDDSVKFIFKTNAIKNDSDN